MAEWRDGFYSHQERDDLALYITTLTVQPDDYESHGTEVLLVVSIGTNAEHGGL